MATNQTSKATSETTDSAGQTAEATGQTADQSETVTVKDMKTLMGLLFGESVEDTKKLLPYKKAKMMVDLILARPQDSTTPDGEEEETTEESKRDGVIIEADCKRMTDLGLGRGIDATKPHPWLSKSSFQVREIHEKCENIIGTEESGQREYYEENINSTLTQQLNTKLTIKEPSKSLSIGIDAEGARSFVETRKSIGERIRTRTVSFKTNYDVQSEDSFEEQMSRWIIDRIESRERWTNTKGTTDSKVPTVDSKGVKFTTSLDQLKAYITSVEPKTRDMLQILEFCYDFIEHLGITHYVHTVKLGAARYKVLTTEDYYVKLESQAGFGLNKVAKVELKSGGGFTLREQRSTTKVNEIGKMDKDKNVVEWKSPDEAVLEIELKPLHTAIPTRALQLATKWALERYVYRREGRREGPFIIACGPENDSIYWQVKDSQVHGTKKISLASLFYILETDSGYHPHEFYIGYVGDNMKALERPKGPTDPVSKIDDLAPTPKYVTAELGMGGSSNKALQVSAGAYRNRARFTLHSSVIRYYRVMRSSVDTDKWAEGGGYFINCARRRLRPDGYIEMKVAPARGGNRASNSIAMEEMGGEEKPSYTTACVTSVDSQGQGRNGPWMVFRLLPGEHKERGKKGEDKSRDGAARKEPQEEDIIEQKEKEKDICAPKDTLVDVGSDPTYRSDDRDFEMLFGNPSEILAIITGQK